MALSDGIDHGRGTFVLVGCGAARADQPREARDRALWQLERDAINVEGGEQAELAAFEDIDERYVATEQEPLPVATADGGEL